MKNSDLERVVDDLRYHTVREVQLSQSSKPARTTSLEIMLGRARRLLRVADGPSARADGFSATTPGNGSPGGGKGGGQRMRITDGGEVDWVPTSSTEAAAIDTRRVDDPVALLGAEAWVKMQAAAKALVELERVLDRFDRLQNTSVVPDPPMCWVAKVRAGLPYDLMWDVQTDGRTTDFAGQLAQPFDEPRKVCMFVYWFVRNHKRLPERPEMLEYLERKTVKVRL